MKIRADYEVGTLESKVEVQINEAVKSIDTLIGSLGTLKSALNNTVGSNSNNKIKDNVDQATKTIMALKSAVNFGAIYVGARKLWTNLKGISTEYIDMVETNNLFEVAMGKVIDQYGNLDEAQSKYYTRAMDFQNQMNEKLATNKSELQKYQSMYYSMLKSQGIDLDSSYKMSESLTKAGYDIASLYNLTVEDAMDKLKSGMAGQVEPLRKIGVDISESALQKVLQDAGIERSVQKLSYAEKEVARYIAIIKQAGQAQGDFAKTFESPANQAKVFKNQLIELKQVAGSFIVNAFQPILVWANAIIMVIKEILKSFANLFGYDLGTNGGTYLGEVSDNVDDIGTGLGTATKKVKEFKKQLLGFDEINNIEAPTTSNGSSSGSGGVAGGIDSKLLDSLKEWDNKMESISGKAQEIRDKMLEWLGFERNDDGTWKLKEGLTNFEKIKDVVETIGIALGTWKIASAITNFMKSFGLLGTGDASKQKGFQIAFGITMLLTGIFAQYKGTQHMLNGDIDLFTLLETVLGTGAGAFGIASILKATNIGKQIGFAKSLQVGLGVMLTFQGIQVLTDGLKNNDVRNQIVGALETGIGMGLAVTSLTGNIVAGLAVSVAVTAAIGLATFIKNITSFRDSLGELKDRIEKTRERTETLTESIKNNSEAYKNARTSIKNSADSKITDLKASEKLIDKLKDLVTENGKVIKGNEKRVDFILKDLSDALGVELTRDGEVIKKNGEVVGSYKELKTSITKVIEQKKKEAKIEAYNEAYKEALKEEIKAKKDLKTAQDNYNEALKDYQEMMKKGYDSDTWISVMTNMSAAEKTLENANKHYKEVTDDIKDTDSKLTNELIKETDKVSNETTKQSKTASKTLQDMLKKSSDEWEKAYDKLKDDQKTSMLTQSTTLDTWSPVLEKKWKNMATNSSNEFTKAISNVPSNVQSKILSAITKTENITPQMQKAWANLAKKSETDFFSALGKVNDDSKIAILKSITTTQGLTNTTSKAWADLASNSKTKYNKALSGLDSVTRDKIQAAVQAVKNKNETMKTTTEKLGGKGKTGLKTGLGTTTQTANNFLKGFNSVITGKDPADVITNIKELAKSILSRFNSALGIRSPSRETKKTAKYFAQGFNLQLVKEMPQSVKQVSEYANNLSNSFNDNLEMNEAFDKIKQGIKVDTQQLSINANEHINYDTIKGQIQTQSNILLNGVIADRIAEASYNAFCKAMRDEGIRVDVEARTDEGIIFKKIQSQAEEFYMQTGEVPFPAY